MCVTLKRFRPRSGRYDINGFISQLLASRRFDELAEKLAEKAANKIINLNLSPVERASHVHVLHNNSESTTQNTQNQSTEEYIKRHGKNMIHVRKGFAGKIDTQAVMNESISLSENLMLKYKYLKKIALERKVKRQRDSVAKNVTNKDVFKLNNTIRFKNEDHKNETERRPSSKHDETQLNQDDAKIEPIDVNKRLQDDTKDEDPKDDLRNRYYSGTDGEMNARSQNKHHQPNEPSPVQEMSPVQEPSPLQESSLVQEPSPVKAPSPVKEPNPVKESSPVKAPSPVKEPSPVKAPSPVKEPTSVQEPSPVQRPSLVQEPSPVQEPTSVQELTSFRVETNSGAEVKEEEEAININNGIKEDIVSSLDEQNRYYLPSEEKTNADVVKTEEEMQPRDEVGNAVAHFRGRKDSVEENKVPSDPDKPKPYGDFDRSVDSNDNRESQERSPENQRSTENQRSGEEQAKPVIRKEGNKVYTYVQAPEYQDYHEEMAKWKKKHPENPEDFL